MSIGTGQSAMMLCGWRVKTGWLIPFVDTRVGIKLCDLSLTRVIPERFRDVYRTHKTHYKCHIY